jgi:carbohydrate-selective porin OprB
MRQSKVRTAICSENGVWSGERSRLLERGLRFDFQYVSDSLWNIKTEEKERFASWNRSTIDLLRRNETDDD